MTMQKRRTRVHRGHKIVALLIERRWNAIVYDAPQGGAIVTADIEEDTAQQAMLKAMQFVDARLDSPPQAAAPRKRGAA